jgi:hypothetical protein
MAILVKELAYNGYQDGPSTYVQDTKTKKQCHIEEWPGGEFAIFSGGDDPVETGIKTKSLALKKAKIYVSTKQTEEAYRKMREVD